MELKIENILIQNDLKIEEAIFLKSDQFEFWHSTIIDSNGDPHSGGFSNDRMQARKIAISELIEKIEFEKLKFEKSQNWGFDLIPTGCGFAAGFNLQNTIQRSINESIERWVMSKWIDDGFKIELINRSTIQDLDPASIFFINQFDEVLFFKKDVALQVNNQFQLITVGLTVGLTELGAFPGSSAQFNNGQIWQHALLESYRHFLGVKNNTNFNTFPGNKVAFFAKNKSIALEQIRNAHKINWPAPEIVLHKHHSYDSNSYFLARTIIGGWQSWDSGQIERFLY